MKQRWPSNTNLSPATVRPEEGEGDNDDTPSPAPIVLTTRQALQATTGRTAAGAHLMPTQQQVTTTSRIL